MPMLLLTVHEVPKKEMEECKSTSHMEGSVTDGLFPEADRNVH